MKLWIDPPSGWKYGFPKIWNGHGNVMDWLVEEGYPKAEIESLGEYFYLKQWPAEDNEV